MAELLLQINRKARQARKDLSLKPENFARFVRFAVDPKP
jgi:hypothetical protein